MKKNVPSFVFFCFLKDYRHHVFGRIRMTSDRNHQFFVSSMVYIIRSTKSLNYIACHK